MNNLDILQISEIVSKKEDNEILEILLSLVENILNNLDRSRELYPELSFIKNYIERKYWYLNDDLA